MFRQASNNNGTFTRDEDEGFRLPGRQPEAIITLHPSPYPPPGNIVITDDRLENDVRGSEQQGNAS